MRQQKAVMLFSRFNTKEFSVFNYKGGEICEKGFYLHNRNF